MARRRRSIPRQRTSSIPKIQKATPIASKPVPVNSTNAQSSMKSGILGALQNMGFYMMGSSMGRLQGENQVLREMANSESVPNSGLQNNNPCANQLSEFVACSNKYADNAMCQQFADALSRCVTLHNPQSSNTLESTSQFSNNAGLDSFSFN